MRSQATRSLKTESGEKNSKEDKFYLEEKPLQTFVRSNYRNNQIVEIWKQRTKA